MSRLTPRQAEAVQTLLRTWSAVRQARAEIAVLAQRCDEEPTPEAIDAVILADDREGAAFRAFGDAVIALRKSGISPTDFKFWMSQAGPA